METTHGDFHTFVIHLNRDQIESNLSVPGIQRCQEHALIKSFKMSPPLDMSVGLLQNPYGPMTLSLTQWSKDSADKAFEASQQTYQVGAHFQALSEPVLMALSDSSYTQVGFNLSSVQVCTLLRF